MVGSNLGRAREDEYIWRQYQRSQRRWRHTLLAAVASSRDVATVKSVAPAPAEWSYAVPALVVEYTVPTPAVTHVAPAPVDEYTAPAPALYAAPAPVVIHCAGANRGRSTRTRR